MQKSGTSLSSHMTSSSKKPPINPVGFGSSFTSVAKQVLQNNNMNFSGDNLSAKNDSISGFHNRSATNPINNSAAKRRTYTNQTPNANEPNNYPLINISHQSSASKNAKEILANRGG